ncbi:MAG: glycosyltransferase family 39 protein [Anaerolineae bacterium]|nr:glycosyltransferase family 39 protein [Anaerolineae bacterium]
MPHRTAINPDRVFLAALGVILLLAASLRFTNLDWDEGFLLHPDERGIVFVAQMIHAPESLIEALSPARSPLNPLRDPDGQPRLYAYGHLPLYANILVAPLARGTGAASDPASALLRAGRILSALWDTLTVLIVALAARELAGRGAGLLAGVLSALSVLHIQNAHFATVDAALAFFCTLCMWLLMRHAKYGHPVSLLLAGATVGFAAGCKATGALLVLPLLATAGRVPRRVLAGALGAAALCFLLTNPYALLDAAVYGQALTTQGAMISGRIDVPFVRQYAGTLPVWYALAQQGGWTLGHLLTTAGYAGILCIWRMESGKTRVTAFPLVIWIVVALLTTTIPMVKFPRYTLIYTPALCVCAAYLLAVIRRQRYWLGWGLYALVVSATGFQAAAFMRIYQEPHPWINASEWVYEYVPPGSMIVTESGDDVLPIIIQRSSVNLIRERLYGSASLDILAEPDGEAKLLRLSGTLSEADYLILASARQMGTVARNESRYPATFAYYECLLSGRLGFEIVTAFNRTGREPGVDFPPMLYPDPSFTDYDHPTVLILRNEGHYASERLRNVITEGCADTPAR